MVTEYTELETSLSLERFLNHRGIMISANDLIDEVQALRAKLKQQWEELEDLRKELFDIKTELRSVKQTIKDATPTFL